jgi:5'-3' exonuclease
MPELLIDGDIICYRAAFSAQDGSPQDAERTANNLIEYTWEQTLDMPFPSPDDYHVYLTGPTNFRKEVAKTAEYKGNRSQDRPIHLDHVKQYLQGKHPTTVSVNEEADDLISIEATSYGSDAIIASIDKDFLQVACKHFNFVTGKWKTVEPFDGLRFFYSQVLTGDAVDNIKGLYRVGPKTAEKMLKYCKTEQELYEACVYAYGGDTDRVLENARLLWLRRYEGEMWTPPV